MITPFRMVDYFVALWKRLSGLNRYLFIGSILLWWGCKSTTDDIDSESLGWHFFPVSIGSQRVYEVDSIIYDEFTNSVDTFRSKVRMRITGIFTDSAGQQVHRVEYDNPDLPFDQPGNRRIAAIRKNKDHVIDYTDSGRVVRLVFPMFNGREWNANMFNNLEASRARIADIDKPFQASDTLWPQTVTVQYFQFINPVTQFEFKEVFARNMGMVFSENVYILRLGGKTSGSRVIMRLIDHSG